MEQLIISCDWGTTSFRLRLVDRGSLLLKGEVLSDDGIGKLHNQWQNDNQLNRNSKEVFYLTYLFRQVEVLTKDITIPLSEIPIVISGMACSSIGMKELPYAVTPFYIDGSSAVIHKIEENIFQLNIFLISGVTNEIDVMRGEETQLVGLAQLELEMMTKDSICILPGTHSKHIKIQNGKIVDFKTFMTGELFDILNRHSILKVAVSGNSGIRSNLNQIDKEAFLAVYNSRNQETY